MRFIALLAITTLGTSSCHGAKHTSVAPNKLNGTWVPVRQEMGGMALPQRALAGKADDSAGRAIIGQWNKCSRTDSILDFSLRTETAEGHYDGTNGTGSVDVLREAAAE